MTDTTEVVDTTIAQTTDTTGAVTEQVQETTETTQETPWFSTYGYESEDHFKTEFEQLRGYKEKASEIEQRLSILQTVDKEIDPEVALFESLKSKMPGAVAMRVMTATEESLSGNPMEAIKLAMRVNNPEQYDKIEKMEGGVEAYLREEYNLDMEGEYTPTRKMQVDALKAIEQIQKIKADVVAAENPYTFAKQKGEERNAQIEASKQLAIVELEKITSGLHEIVDTQGDKSFNLKVSKEELSVILKDKEQIATFFPDANTPEGRAKLEKFVHDRIRYAKYDSGEVFKMWESTHAADIAQATVKEVLNGSAKGIDRTSSTATEKPSLITQVAIAEGRMVAP